MSEMLSHYSLPFDFPELIGCLFPFQLKKAVKSLGYDCLDDICLKDLTDIDDLVRPLEVLALKNKDNAFVASNSDIIENLTTHQTTDSALTVAMKDHIKSELLIICILKLISKCKQIVTLFKTSGLNDRLEGGALRQEVDTRWMSVLDMLKSFFPSSSSKVLPETKFKNVSVLILL